MKSKIRSKNFEVEKKSNLAFQIKLSQYLVDTLNQLGIKRKSVEICIDGGGERQGWLCDEPSELDQDFESK